MIPNIIHFIFGLKSDFGGKPFSLVHYLSVKSAYDINKPDHIYFHYHYLPSGEWWEKASSYLTLAKVKIPNYIFWNKLHHFAHKADILRLKILRDQGGIYLDLDTICVRPLTELLKFDFVIGKQGGTTKGLCNAVMLAKPNSKFINRWIWSYTSFRSKGYGHYWDEHSVLKPKLLSEKYPNDVHILDEYAFHYPTWEHPSMTKLLFVEAHIFNKAYVHHLWESSTWECYLSKLTVKDIKENATSYNLLARQFLND